MTGIKNDRDQKGGRKGEVFNNFFPPPPPPPILVLITLLYVYKCAMCLVISVQVHQGSPAYGDGHHVHVVHRPIGGHS